MEINKKGECATIAEFTIFYFTGKKYIPIEIIEESDFHSAYRTLNELGYTPAWQFDIRPSLQNGDCDPWKGNLWHGPSWDTPWNCAKCHKFKSCANILQRIKYRLRQRFLIPIYARREFAE